LGALAEVVTGKQPQVWLATSKEQVLAVVGKRGSGKSFTLGVLVEGLASGSGSPLGRQSNARATLVFDPLDIYWTTRYPVSPADNAEAQRHYEMARSAHIASTEFDLDAWVPGQSNRRPSDPDWFRTLQLSVPSLGLEEWELLLGINVLSDVMGQALSDALSLARDKGYTLKGEFVSPSASFDLPEVVNALNSAELTGVYHPETLRAVGQRLGALSRTGMFTATGTRIEDLLSPGRASVILLGRLPQSYREAVVSLLTRMLIEARSRAAFAEKRLALDPELSAAKRREIEETIQGGVPRTVVVLDEAQSFLGPGPASSTRAVFIQLVKEGRNIGLSAVLASQQPSAIDSRILSQVETFVSHQLVTDPDIRAVRDNRKSSAPSAIQFGNQALDDEGLMRQLPPGVCVISAADMNTAVRRSIVVAVRPRATVHGGIEL
jgi:DNA helicase HerA-like ATPase